MYRRPRSLEILIRIREEMAREADFDVDLFVERIRSGEMSSGVDEYTLDEVLRSNGMSPKERRIAKQN